ncbi:MAG: DUF1461 domain-containing protein [Clostridia bacterium]|nr:DUF1461 domain-containing protein [Clostridia bacterium]
MKKTIIYRILTVCATIAIFIVVGFIAIMVPANSKAFYRWQFEKHNTLEWVQSQADGMGDSYSSKYNPEAEKYVANMTEVQLEELMLHVMRYCMWIEDSLDITVEGESLSVFRADEKSHLSDVRNLFGAGMIVTLISLLACIVFLFFLLNRPKEYYESSRNVPFITLAVLVGLIAFVAVFACIDFTVTFEIFHKILFTGNYSFSNGVMISMISEIFPDLALIIGISWLITLAIPIVALIFYNRHVAKKICAENTKQSEETTANA